MSEKTFATVHPLGTAPIGPTLLRFAIPAVISNLVSAAYNMTDQIFIGQGVGMLGNAATNVAFPIAIICAVLALLFAIGGAAGFHLEMGRGNLEKAKRIAGPTFVCLIGAGLVLCIAIRIFMFFTFLNGCQPLIANFFTTISKPLKGAAVSLTRQTVFLLPLILLLPRFFGLDGGVYAGPIADILAFFFACGMALYEFHQMPKADGGMPDIKADGALSLEVGA